MTVYALWVACAEVVVVLEVEQAHSAAECSVPMAAVWRSQVARQRSRSKVILMLQLVLAELLLVVAFRLSVPASSGPRMVETG